MFTSLCYGSTAPSKIRSLYWLGFEVTFRNTTVGRTALDE
jgi:hypothetical protein